MRSERVLSFSFALAGISLVASSHAGASALCDYYRKDVPELYKIVCTNGSASTKPAGANSTFSDAFNLNTASLPTEPSSYGLEVIESGIRPSFGPRTTTFSLIKGFHRFGTGISTGSNNTFWGNDIVQRAYGRTSDVTTFESEPPVKDSGPINLNLGTSIAIHESRDGPSFRLGLSLRYNRITNTWGGGPGLMINWGRWTFGGGYTREMVSNVLPRITFTSAMLGVRIWVLEFEYTQLQNIGGVTLEPIQIFSVSTNIRKVTLTAAVRHLNYLRVLDPMGSSSEVVQSHYAVQYLFSKHFSAGFLYNYIPGASSLGAQFFL